MAILKKINDGVLMISKYLSIIMYIIMLLTASLQILMRFVFKMPLAWTDESSKFAFVWGTMLGCAILVRTNGHSCVEIMGNALRGTVKAVHRLVIDFACMLLYCIIIYGGIILMQAGATSVSPALNIPMWFVYGIMPLSGIIMVLFQLELIFIHYAQWKKEG